MVSYAMKVTEAEYQLLQTISEIGYGEILEVELDGDGRPTINATMTSQRQALVKLIREGVVSFRTIKIHQSEPAYAEVFYRSKFGFKIKKLYKFN